MPSHHAVEAAVLAGIALLFCLAILAVSTAGADAGRTPPAEPAADQVSGSA